MTFLLTGPTKLTIPPADRAPTSMESHALAAEGKRVLVGIPEENSGGKNGAGAAYTFDADRRFQSPNVLTREGFGASVAMCATRIVIGGWASWPEYTGASWVGAVYAYGADGKRVTLIPSGLSYKDIYGYSVAVTPDGNTIFVGAPWDDTNNTNSGAVYVWNRQSDGKWKRTGKLTTATKGSAAFGADIACTNDLLVVGASGESRAYVFSDPAWGTKLATLAPDPNEAWGDYSQFGFSVAASGDTIAVGAPHSDSSKGKDTGQVHIFKRSGSLVKLQARISAADKAPSDGLGWSVALHGNLLVAGLRKGGSTFSPAPGAAYVFTRAGETWTQQMRLSDPDLPTTWQYGTKVALSDSRLFLATPRSSTILAYDYTV